MNKFYTFLFAVVSLLGITTANAQTILEEDFELGENPTRIARGDGWTTVNSYNGSNTRYNWYNYYSKSSGQQTSGGVTYTNQPIISGDNCAACDGPISTTSNDGVGPREEILLSPELDLNDTYQLQFSWKVSPMASQTNSLYDLQVRIVIGDDLKNAETIFSIQDKNMLKESGVLDYPITTWDLHISKLDLSDWKGEKVKIAFVYKMMAEISNIVWLDDISVKQFTPATGPVATISSDRYNFGTVYIGEKFWSESFRLSNTGKNGLRITSIDMPEGISTNLNYESLTLDMYDYIDFNFAYSAQRLTTPASGNIVLHTTGGDVTIAYTAEKQLVPEGMFLETFEGFFPPAGWKNGGWSQSNTGIEGDHSLYCGGNFSASYVTSPRLDLMDGGTVTFTYYNLFDDEDYESPEYDVELQVSYDDGNTWTTRWTAPYDTESLNKLITVSVDLGEGSDNSYVRWYYPAVEVDDEGAYPHSSFYLDRVLLPNLFGADGLPTGVTMISPAMNADNVYPKNIKLEWGPAQFAHGYKVYVGTNSACNDLIDGLDVGNVLSYTIPEVAYETQYRWRVVAYNDLGASQTYTTWRFTTQPDASVSSYPYVEDFTVKALPMGWLSVPAPTYSREWYVNDYFPYQNGEVKSNAFTSSWLQTGESNSVATQEFILPSDKSMQISFVWGDEHPRDLVVDQTGLVKKQNVEPNNGASDCTFEIYADGEWTVLSHISENTFDGDRKYWIEESFDLSAYAGKKVQFRWTHYSFSGSDNGTSLAHIVLEERLSDKAGFNHKNWDAGKVNFNGAVKNAEEFTLLNKGVNPLVVKSATFTTENFSTTLEAGTTIQPESGVIFGLQFNAKESNDVVEDVLTVEFESGYSTTLPVRGEALAEDIYYYSFEPNDLDRDWTKDFTLIDADNAFNFAPSAYWIHYSADGGKSAFTVEDDDMETGMYGIMSPVSGTHALVAASPVESAGKSADNWIISQKLRATATSVFDFYARNWESAESVLPSPAHHVTVLVSTATNTNTSDFTAVMRDTEMPYLSGHAWNHYEVDLSAYAGQDIYVAVRHTTNGASNLAFFDDFTLSHFLPEGTTGIGLALSDIKANDCIEVLTATGAKILTTRGTTALNSLPRGLYIIRVNGTRTVKFVKK